MDNPDRDQVRRAWQDATDVEVAGALHNEDDYPPEELSVIQAEARRRQIDSDDPELDNAGSEHALAQLTRLTYRLARLLGAAGDRFFGRHRLIGAACVAVGVALLSRLPPDADTRLEWTAKALLIVTCYLTGLAYNCRPLRRYRTAVSVTAVAWACHAVIGAVSVLRMPVSFPLEVWLRTCTIHAVIVWLIPCVLLCAVAFVRNRYRPVRPEGHCVVCGYDLRGLPEPRCPECGTPFDVGEKGASG
jgi:hypothetical protein